MKDHFTIVETATRTRTLEKDFSSLLDAVRTANIIQFAYPGCPWITPVQWHRIVELLKECGTVLKASSAAWPNR